jgi:hypothetical protein
MDFCVNEGVYIAFKSTFYRVLKAADQLNRRGKAKEPKNVVKHKGYKATAANQVWSYEGFISIYHYCPVKTKVI